MKTKKPDTAFLARPRAVQTENLLDQTAIADLRTLSSSGQGSLLQEVVSLFLENAPQRVAQISQSVNDAPMLAFHAHALKSMSLNLGAKRIIELSQKLEDLGRTRNVHGAPALVRELEAAYLQTRAQLVALRGR